MIYQLQSIKILVSEVVSNLALGDREINYQDMYSWIADGLKHIGAYYQFTHKTADIEIEDYKGELPCDFYAMVRYMGSNQSTDSIFSNSYLIGDSDTTVENTSNNTNNYKINHNIITVGFREGTFSIQYLAFPLDDEGLPMVPDNEEYRNALYWKIIFHLGMQGYEFKNKKLNDIEYTGNKWNRLKISARAEAYMPDQQGYEELKNGYLKLIPTNNDFSRRFVNTNKPENLNLNGSN
jgi:hypothetical protein